MAVAEALQMLKPNFFCHSIFTPDGTDASICSGII
jgi:hypothetical protein